MIPQVRSLTDEHGCALWEPVWRSPVITMRGDRQEGPSGPGAAFLSFLSPTQPLPGTPGPSWEHPIFKLIPPASPEPVALGVLGALWCLAQKLEEFFWTRGPGWGWCFDFCCWWLFAAGPLEGAPEWLDRPVALRSVTLYLAARCISFCLSGSGGLAIVSPEVLA